MPPSDNQPAADTRVDGQSLAVLAESLYLANLLLAPGLAFGILLYLHSRHVVSAPPLARCHLGQTLSASLWAGVLLILVAAFCSFPALRSLKHCSISWRASWVLSCNPVPNAIPGSISMTISFCSGV